MSEHEKYSKNARENLLQSTVSTVDDIGVVGLGELCRSPPHFPQRGVGYPEIWEISIKKQSPISFLATIPLSGWAPRFLKNGKPTIPMVDDCCSSGRVVVE